MPVPEIRIRSANDAPINSGGEFVLYWMIAHRRVTSNFGLQQAIDRAKELGKPLVIFEVLRCRYQWASDRIHQFVIDGMRDNIRSCSEQNVAYFPHLERRHGESSGLLESLASRAAIVVTDDFPCFFLPRMVAAVAKRMPVHLECVDSNGLLPMRAADKVFARAYDFRRFLQKNLRPHLSEFPHANPLRNARELPAANGLLDAINAKWPAADLEGHTGLENFEIDHSVKVVDTNGGSKAATAALDVFFKKRLVRYADERNQPEQTVASELSAYLHFGHISVHEIFSRVVRSEAWDESHIAETAKGSSSGWWGMSPSAEAFLDQVITWREVGYNMCWHRRDYDQYESLPEWAQRTLREHTADPREHVYSLDEFAQAKTHDTLWNAAQNQLVRDGRIHNYLRMLWGKKILEWTATPQDALNIMIELNNKYALDGRNPNSYSGIFWVLGRYDRAWGPERPIFGKIRYMTSANTARKVRVKDYIREYAGETLF